MLKNLILRKTYDVKQSTAFKKADNQFHSKGHNLVNNLNDSNWYQIYILHLRKYKKLIKPYRNLPLMLLK